MASSITFRPRRDQDDDFILNVTQQTLGDIFRDSVGMDMSESFLLKHIRTCETTLIERDGKPVGYYSFLIYQPERLYWSMLVLSAQEQGKGLGGLVVDRVIHESRAKGVRAIELHVQTKNLQSYHFVLKKGFVQIGPPEQGSIPFVLNLQPPQ